MKLKLVLAFLLGVVIFHSSIYLYIRYANFDTDETIVAVLDTGVDYNHEMLKGKVIKGYDFSSTDKDPMDEDGHGTHVSGIVSQISPTSKILAVRVINEREPLGFRFAVPLLYSILKGADVVNMSLSGEYDQLSQWVIRLGIKKGVVFVASSGNSSSNEIVYPAKYEGVLAIAAFDENGKTIYEDSNLSPSVDFLAPGVNVNSAGLNNTYSLKTGTSMAAAHVSGIFAKMKEETELTTDEIFKEIQNNSVEVIADRAYRAIDSKYMQAIKENKAFVWQQGVVQENGSTIDFNVNTVNSDKVEIYVDGELFKDVQGNLDAKFTLTLEDGVHEVVTVATPSERERVVRFEQVKPEQNKDITTMGFPISIPNGALMDIQKFIIDTQNPLILLNKEWADHALMMVIKVEDFTLEDVKITMAKKTITYTKEVLGSERIYIPVSSRDFPIHIEAYDYNGNTSQVIYENFQDFREIAEPSG